MVYGVTGDLSHLFFQQNEQKKHRASAKPRDLACMKAPNGLSQPKRRFPGSNHSRSCPAPIAREKYHCRRGTFCLPGPRKKEGEGARPGLFVSAGGRRARLRGSSTQCSNYDRESNPVFVKVQMRKTLSLRQGHSRVFCLNVIYVNIFDTTKNLISQGYTVRREFRDCRFFPICHSIAAVRFNKSTLVLR